MTLEEQRLELEANYIKAFIEKHEFGDQSWYKEGDGTVAIGDYCMELKDIITDIDSNADVDMFFKWYDYTIETKGKSMTYDRFLEEQEFDYGSYCEAAVNEFSGCRTAKNYKDFFKRYVHEFTPVVIVEGQSLYFTVKSEYPEKMPDTMFSRKYYNVEHVGGFIEKLLLF